MDLKALLNMDMATLGQALRGGLDWWLGELKAMLPTRWRKGGEGRRLAFSIEGEHAVFRRWDGQAWIPVERPSGRQVEQAALVLPPGMVLAGEFDLPVPSMADLYRMVALDLDRLTPFRADEVVFDLEVAAGDGSRAPLRRVVLGLVRRTDLADIDARLKRLGLSPAAIAFDDGGILRFDFARRAMGGAPARSGLVTRVLRYAVPVLLFINLGLIVLRDQGAVDSLRETVESQRLQVQLVDRLRKRVEAEETRRQAFIDRRQAQSPLALLDVVTTLLPDTAWSTLFEWDGHELRLSGISSEPLDVAALLATSPLLRNVRAVDGAPASDGGFAVAAGAAGRQP